ncbi:MAG: nucleotidyl transferase AbiEii/AbiGii toxin family protein [Treponema sp.]|nr:nucleotidyl transferase AbiEii/AbiGii toxin family protein [Treponema sp.]
MNSTKPNSRRNLDIAIDRLFGIESNTIQVRTLIANTIIGQMLPKGVVKGGSALKLRYGDKTTRFTRDLDTARAEDLDKYLKQLEVSLSEGYNDFTGIVIRKNPAKPKGIPGEYIMQPFEIKLSYMGKSWLTVNLEIGYNEIGDADSFDNFLSQDIINIFEKLGFPKPKPIPLMQIHHQIAQKLHALSEIGSERAHDLIDLQIIKNNEKIDYNLTKNTCKRLFVYRKQQEWPPVIIKGNNWNTLYSSQITGIAVLQNVDDAIDWVNGLIKMIDEG